jgi:hypothetical protein
MGLFVDYGVEDISSKLVIPSLVFSIITPLFIIGRFVTRWVYMRSFGPDDWAILGSCVGNLLPFGDVHVGYRLTCSITGFLRDNFDTDDYQYVCKLVGKYGKYFRENCAADEDLFRDQFVNGHSENIEPTFRRRC